MTTPRDSDAPLDRDAPTERSMSAVSHDAPGGSAAVAPTALGQLGRFVLLDSRGAGGMGIVFAAYDPELDRKVALKLLHPGRGAHFDGHIALMREAQAMARVAHPNVVTVYEVGLVGEQPFVAMELIDGPSLASWLQAQPRPWRAIVAMFVDAGRGLAAVHAAGLVHRDVKPGNILIGRDGRARLGDFGLANSHDAAASAAGTPAYMAPEQRAGSALDARADQFAFCVALWEALYGARPFATTSAAREAEPLRVPRGEVPGWVGAIALRGLARDPAERWPSMSALLAALARDPAIARRRIAFGGALVGLAAIGTWGVTRYQATDDPCASGDDGMHGAWDAPRQAEVQTAFTATALPYASATWDRVDHALGRYAGEWLAMRREACRATRVDGRQSDTLMDLRMACLDRARDRLAAVTTRWAGGVDATALEKATHAIDDLAPLSACADATALGARAPLPNDPAIVAAIGKVRARVDDAAALRAIGKITEARTAAEAARAEAMRTGWPQVEAEAAFEVGATLSTLGVPEAETALVETAHLAGAAHDDFLAADAMIRALETISGDQNEGARALQLAPVVEVLVARAGDGLDLRGNLDASRSDAF
ncbi:MAG: serine/threonine protein kinase, partial [Deltaproteobacteria bacterium]|nr:serine/threonine protein kinase [Deltaproteobacteria bacterium]